MKRFLSGLAVVTMLVALGTASARSVDTDPNKEYYLTPEAGPWVICAATYSGPESGAWAHQLVMEIRTKFNLPAYVFNRSREEKQKQQEELNKLRSMCPEGRFRHYRIEDQYAILVGGYKDMDTARSELTRLKKLDLDPKFMYRIGLKDQKDPTRPANTLLDPFVMAFVVPNPTLPQRPETEKQCDDQDFLRKINDGEPLSVYHCRKPWTLVVAMFRGPGTFEKSWSTNFLDKLVSFGRDPGEQLAASGQNAHNLAEVLRSHDPDPKKNMGYEAYVLHTRNYSVVTIGGFDSKDDPQMRQMEQALLSRLRLGANAGFSLLAQPMPMEVPK